MWWALVLVFDSVHAVLEMLLRKNGDVCVSERDEGPLFCVIGKEGK